MIFNGAKYMNPKHSATYHGLVTAKKLTKTGHTILQLDYKTEVLVMDKDPDCPSLPDIYDSVLYRKVMPEAKVTFQAKGQKPQVVTFKSEGIHLITVQLSERSQALMRRRREELRQEEERIAALKAEKERNKPKALVEEAAR